jgi:hypothetical protein
MIAGNISKTILGLVGAIFIAAAISALIFFVLSQLGLYSDAYRPIVYSIVVLVVIPIFRRVIFRKPLLIIFIAALIPLTYLMKLELVASILLGYLVAVAVGAGKSEQVDRQ